MKRSHDLIQFVLIKRFMLLDFILFEIICLWELFLWFMGIILVISFVAFLGADCRHSHSELEFRFSENYFLVQVW
jgi:hypothetical protein